MVIFFNKFTFSFFEGVAVQRLYREAKIMIMFYCRGVAMQRLTLFILNLIY